MPTKIASITASRPPPGQAKLIKLLDKAKEDEVFSTDELAKAVGYIEVRRFDTEMKDKYSILLRSGTKRMWGHPNAIKKLRQLYGN